jgi:hypothetical protein
MNMETIAGFKNNYVEPNLLIISMHHYTKGISNFRPMN